MGVEMCGFLIIFPFWNKLHFGEFPLSDAALVDCEPPTSSLAQLAHVGAAPDSDLRPCVVFGATLDSGPPEIASSSACVPTAAACYP